jgi:hypothetical protein
MFKLSHLRASQGRTVTIDAFQPSDLDTVIRFVEAIQEHGRIDVPDLKSGNEVGSDYAPTLIRTASEKSGCIMARAETVTVGFGALGLKKTLIRAFVMTRGNMDTSPTSSSKVFGVGKAWLRLLEVLELEMRARGCGRMRICSKAANHLALACYKRAGYEPHEIVLTKRLDV